MFGGRRGTSGFVQKALDMRTGQPVAVKLVPRGPGAQSFDAQHITRELLNHRMVRHPQQLLLGLKCAAQTESAGAHCRSAGKWLP
jgi:serine/threonine protein kinase